MVTDGRRMRPTQRQARLYLFCLYQITMVVCPNHRYWRSCVDHVLNYANDDDDDDDDDDDYHNYADNTLAIS